MVLLRYWSFLVFTVTQVSAKSISPGENHSLQSEDEILRVAKSIEAGLNPVQQSEQELLVVENTNSICRPEVVGVLRFQATKKLLEICDGSQWLFTTMEVPQESYGRIWDLEKPWSILQRYSGKDQNIRRQRYLLDSTTR